MTTATVARVIQRSCYLLTIFWPNSKHVKLFFWLNIVYTRCIHYEIVCKLPNVCYKVCGHLSMYSSLDHALVNFCDLKHWIGCEIHYKTSVTVRLLTQTSLSQGINIKVLQWCINRNRFWVFFRAVHHCTTSQCDSFTCTYGSLVYTTIANAYVTQEVSVLVETDKNELLLSYVHMVVVLLCQWS